MKKLLRAICFVLCLLTVSALTPSFVTADEDMVARIAECDYVVYAGAYFDAVAETNVTGAKYRWVARFKDETSFVSLEDNLRYSGTDTPHFRFLSSEGYVYGSDWELIQFACMITAPDGRIRMTPTVSMIILPVEDFIKDAGEQNLGITDFSVSGYSPVSESDGVLFYNVPAGEAVTFSVSADRFADEFKKSEAEAVVEITVTEDGKTTKLQTPDERFTVRRVGNSEVSARADLVAYINGERIVTLDSRQIVINAVSPDWEAEATVRAACSLLEGPYGESRRIGEFAKGDEVRVISRGGTWSRIIGADGTIGYVSTDRLDITDTIRSVDVRIQEPVEGVPVDGAVTLGGGGYSLYATDPVTWTDVTDGGRILGAGETFRKGHVYSVSVWIEADDDRDFGVTGSYDTAVSGTLNGMTATVTKAYEQDPERVVDVSYTFGHTHDPVRVDQVPPTCTEPGRALHFRCSCGAEFADNRGLDRITDENRGVFPPRGHKESEWRNNGTEHYKLCLRRECGVLIPESVGTHTGGTADCRTQAVCSVCGALYGEKADHVYSDAWDYRDAFGHAHRCTTLGCGAHGETVPHVPGPAATETEPQVCLECGYVLEWAAAQNPFTDVFPADYYYDAVLWAVNASPQITAGTTATTFSPNATCTRAQVVTFLWRASGEPEPADPHNPFVDVSLDQYYYKAVLWAVGKRITSGTGPTTFSPDEGCTRAQVVTFLWRASGEPEPATPYNPFVDVTSDQYYYKAVLWAVGNGVTSGTSATTFSPDDVCTRGQIVTFLFRAENA